MQTMQTMFSRANLMNSSIDITRLEKVAGPA